MVPPLVAAEQMAFCSAYFLAHSYILWELQNQRITTPGCVRH